MPYTVLLTADMIVGEVEITEKGALKQATLKKLLDKNLKMQSLAKRKRKRSNKPTRKSKRQKDRRQRDHYLGGGVTYRHTNSVLKPLV